MDDYEYRPLDTTRPGFRLLRLLKGDTINIECDIFHSTLSERDTVPYEALSYTWGNTELVDTITVDGQRLWITENLHSALQCLRSRHQDRVLWIDAVCINQSDKQEQSQQVLAMGKIFGFAKRVIFWLGKPTPGAALLMQSLIDLETQIFSAVQIGANVSELAWKQLWSDVQQSESIRKHLQSTRQQEGLETLLRRPWFTRVWILQEVMNARNAVVCSGTFSVSADIFALSPSLLGIAPGKHIQSILDLMPRSPVVDSQYQREKEDLSTLLLKFGGCQATDKRDMVFALLGMSMEPIDHRFLRPDYNRPASEIIYNTIRYWFEETEIPIPRVLDALSSLDTLRVTYLIPLARIKDDSRKDRSRRVLTGCLKYLENDIENMKRGLRKCYRWGRHMEEEDEMEENEEGTKTGLAMIFNNMACVRDASLCLPETSEDKSPENECFLHAEMDAFDRDLSEHDTIIREHMAVYIDQWPNAATRIKFLIVHDTREALKEAARKDYGNIFEFILNDITRHNPTWLGDFFLSAMSEKRWDLVSRLVNRGLDAGILLHGASLLGWTDVVHKLLDLGIDVNERGSSYGNALVAASFGGNVETAKTLLDYGADVNAEGFEYGNALLVAIRRLDAGLERWYHEEKTDPGAVLQQQWFDDHIEMVKLLLDRGADPNARGTTYDQALLVAIDADEWVPRKIQYRAKVYWEQKRIHDFDLRDRDTPIEAMTTQCRVRMVQLLLENGANVNKIAKGRYTALQVAAFHGFSDIAKLLIHHGADENAVSSALRAAIYADQKDTVAMLLDHGVDLSTRMDGYTAIEYALYYDRAKLVPMLAAAVWSVPF